jgi:hypothetical protein
VPEGGAELERVFPEHDVQPILAHDQVLSTAFE